MILYKNYIPLTVYQDYLTFVILGNKLNLISESIHNKEYTVAEYRDFYYYLGEVSPTIESAIFAWEKINNVTLTSDEISQITINNHTKKKKEEIMAAKKTTKKPAKKPAAKKPAAKKPAAKKPAAKKPAAKKPAAKKPAAKKPAGKKTAAKKLAAKRTASKKASVSKPSSHNTVSTGSPVVDSTGVVTINSNNQ